MYTLNGTHAYTCNAHYLTLIYLGIRQIYGGIGIGVGVAAGLSVVALSNVSGCSLLPYSPDVILLVHYTFENMPTLIWNQQRSYIWTRVCKFIWPFIIVIAAVRAIIMIVELQRG